MIMTRSNAARAASFAGLLFVLILPGSPSKAAVFNDGDIARMSEISDAITSLDDDVSRTMHNLPQDNAEEIEAFSYIELNLQAAQERLNSIFLLTAVAIYMESEADQLQIENLLYRQVLPQSRTFLHQKTDAIASMALAHPGNDQFKTYSAQAGAILSERAVPLLQGLSDRIAAALR
jgi:hypothetical protein